MLAAGWHPDRPLQLKQHLLLKDYNLAVFFQFSLNETEISIDVVDMIEFKGLVRFLITDVTKEGENETLFRNEIGFPPTLFKDALNDKLASGGSKENSLIFQVYMRCLSKWRCLYDTWNNVCQ